MLQNIFSFLSACGISSAFCGQNTDGGGASESAHEKSGKRNKGFYIALGVCLIAVGAAAWTTYSSVSNYTSPKTNVQSEAKKTDNTVSGVNVKFIIGTSEKNGFKSAGSLIIFKKTLKAGSHETCIIYFARQRQCNAGVQQRACL